VEKDIAHIRKLFDARNNAHLIRIIDERKLKAKGK
jgi:hypothetical protein